MTAEEILAVARTHDIALEVHGDRLVVDAPVGALTPEVRAELVRHKPALVALLARTFVTLKNGLILPLPAITLALDLERRGVCLSLDADRQLVVAPAAALTDLDRAAICRWRLHLGAIVAYIADTEDRYNERDC
jgi:tubulysin polyketide synthase-like protein